MATSLPITDVADEQPFVDDHQRTYVGDPDLHKRLLGFVGETVTPNGGPCYSIRRSVGGVAFDRTLVTWYFDTEQLDLYSKGAMLRCRARQESNGDLPSSGLFEARKPGSSGTQRIVGKRQPFDLQISDLSDPSLLSVNDLTGGRPLRAVASQIKVRQLLFAGFGALGSCRPEVVITIDEVQLASLSDQTRQESRHEVELQIFTKLPWTKRQDDARVDRFEAFASAVESQFGLVEATTSSYQAVPARLLR